MYTYQWRGPFDNSEVNRLHAEGFKHPLRDHDWSAQLHGHSLGWICARDGDSLIGFVNVAWDGGVHAFVLDTLVSAANRGHGVGTALITVATDSARTAGCEWLHVDFEEHLRRFYLEAGRFTETDAGVISL